MATAQKVWVRRDGGGRKGDGRGGGGDGRGQEIGGRGGWCVWGE